MRATAAQRAVLRDPGLNKVTLYARQQGLAVVQRQAERIEGRMGVDAATSGNFVGLLRPIVTPHSIPAPGLPCAEVSTPMFGTVSGDHDEHRGEQHRGCHHRWRHDRQDVDQRRLATPVAASANS